MTRPHKGNDMTTITTQTPAAQSRSLPSQAAPLEVLPLSATEWRVRTTDLPEADGRSVLGIVQRLGDTYEVMQIGLPLFRYYFASLDGAVEYLGRTR